MNGYHPSDLDLAAFQRGRETGNATPLLTLCDRSCRRAVGLALRILSDVSRAEDVVEQVTLEMWRAPLFDPRLFDSFDAWFLAHGHRAAIDGLRAQQDAGSPHDVSEEVESPAVDPEHTTTSDVVPEERQVLDLAYFAGLTYDVIAERLEIGPAQVLRTKRHGLHQLSATKHEGQSAGAPSPAFGDGQRRGQPTDRPLNREDPSPAPAADQASGVSWSRSLASVTSVFAR